VVGVWQPPPAAPRDSRSFTRRSRTTRAGFSTFSLAGLTAVDYLIDHLELEPTGCVTADGVPSVTPFENGRPRRHTRLFSRPDLDVTVLVAELFVPPTASPALADAIRLVETVATVYGFGIDPGPLEGFVAEVEQYYAGLAERLAEREASPHDRMYM